jgi:DNA polymerase III alpha subunit (gram-positive type)
LPCQRLSDKAKKLSLCALCAFAVKKSPSSVKIFTMIPLTVRSSYSLMWGTAYVTQVCRQAKRLGYDRLALTDTDNLYGLWPFLTTCKREGLSPIVGAEVTHAACSPAATWTGTSTWRRFCPTTPPAWWC